MNNNSPSLFIKSARQKLNLSQKKLGDKLGISRDRIRDYENNRSRMPAQVYIAIQDLLKSDNVG